MGQIQYTISSGRYTPLTVCFLKALAPTPTGSNITGILAALQEMPVEIEG